MDIEEKLKEYEMVIGLEVHAELATKTKMYCSCSTKYGADPNTECCPVCTGLPGSLPVLNKKAVEYIVKLGLATNSKIARYSKQDRKNYFYPDTPKAYQISQFDLPLGYDGYIDITKDSGEKKRIGITRMHIEEDAAKLIHDAFSGDTLVDMNRCSLPLIEIVSEPDIRDAEEAVKYMQTLKGILEYLEICDCKMEQGSLRCDVNLSIRKRGASKFGTRTETKNLNSFKAIEHSINFEFRRQVEALENGEKIVQETRRFDDAKGVGYSMRTKEEAKDYRYFPEPDLATIRISEEYINNITASLPEMPEARKARYIKEYNLSNYDAEQITSSKKVADFMDETVKIYNNPKAISNWLQGDFARMLKENNIAIEDSKISHLSLANLVKLIDEKVISGTIAKKVFEEMFNDGKDALVIVEEKGLKQITDSSEIEKMVDEVIESNPKSIEDYFNGKDRALGFLVGQVMKASKGKANPQAVNELVKNALDKLSK